MIMPHRPLMFFPTTPAKPPADAALGDAPEAEAWNWVIETLAAELAQLPGGDRAALIATLTARAGYEVADEGSDRLARAHNARVHLTAALAARAVELETTGAA